ncbi:hypothetical protein, partial [Bartonella sp. CR84HXZ]|uniref:hypothetical protein n=1 Tax=Bartonella sp. CR84HXZ TaxID=1460997 RepID=UPI0035CF1D8D
IEMRVIFLRRYSIYLEISIIFDAYTRSPKAAELSPLLCVFKSTAIELRASAVADGPKATDEAINFEVL